MPKNGNLIGTMRKSGTEQIRVSFCEFNRQMFVDARVYVMSDGELWPTKKGVRVMVERAGELGDLLKSADRMWRAQIAQSSPGSASSPQAISTKPASRK